MSNEKIREEFDVWVIGFMRLGCFFSVLAVGVFIGFYAGEIQWLCLF